MRAFIVAHGDSRFGPIEKAAADRLIINRAGWYDQGVFYIGTDAWKEIHKGATASRAARYLLEAGFLIRGEDGRLQTKLSRKVGRLYAYAIREDVMEAGDG